MRTRVAYLIIILGVLGLVGQVFYRVQRERNVLEAQMQAQQSSLAEGLRAAWKVHLLEMAKAGKLKPAFQLRWSRQGTELRDVFFPIKKSTLEWEKYRRFTKNLKTLEAKQFLQSALERENSWDRVLAITEWQEQYKISPEVKTEYERTLIDSEAKTAYRLIFDQFSTNRDFTFTSSEIEYDKVFYSVAKDGSIEAFVPSIKQTREEFLPSFLIKNNLSFADIGETPWTLILPRSLIEKTEFSYLELVGLLLALLCFLTGIIIYFGGLREQKKILLRRVSFLNQVVHELKTPLTGLKLHLQLIQKGQGGKQNLEALDDSLDRLNTLFDDVILMNRPFEKIVAQAIKAEEGQKMLLDLKEEFHLVQIKENFNHDFYGDKKRLRIILRNLIKNGIRYGKEVMIQVSHESNKVVVVVSDQGPGVSESDSQKIFQEFFRSEEAKKINSDGLGLGLYLVKKMTQEMGANIELTNPGQKGAVFKLTLNGIEHG